MLVIKYPHGPGLTLELRKMVACQIKGSDLRESRESLETAGSRQQAAATRTLVETFE